MATVVFADMVGSTGMFERLGDKTASRFLTQLTTALAPTFEQHHGRVVKMLGDGLFVVFPPEEFAIAACVAIQGRLHERPLYAGGAGSPVQMQRGVASGHGGRISLGRASNATLALNDSRVSRLHAAVEWRDAHFVLTDASNFGPWVYLGRQEEPPGLHRSECFLAGEGLIALGCDRHAEEAPVVALSVRA